MGRRGLLIDYEYCYGCHTCEVACKQEHNLPVGKCGIHMQEMIFEGMEDRLQYDYLPFPTELCNLCAERYSQGLEPSCVKHCQAGCMMSGTLEELLQYMEKSKSRKIVLYTPV